MSRIRNSRLRCYVIGDGPDRGKLENAACALGLKGQVVFTGRQDNVADWLSILDVFVLPSDSGESFGNAAVEAMAVGIPTIVMADGGGLVEHFPPGYRDFPRNERELGQRIAELLSNSAYAERMAEACNQYVREKYSVTRMLAGYEALYESALQGR